MTNETTWSPDPGGVKRLAETSNVVEGIRVLNPKLYTALRNIFPAVEVIKNGVPFDGRVVTASGTGHTHIDRIDGGEEYHVNCPWCGDTRGRLYVNHMWNTTYAGCRMRYSLFCHNEQCHAAPGFIDQFIEMLNCGVMNESDIRTDVAVSVDKVRPEVKGKFTRIDRLPDDHAAVRYLRDMRKLPIDRLGEIWNVTWAEYSLTLPPDNRLYFPIRAEDPDNPGTMIEVGGQAHWLDPRTLSGTPSKEQRKNGEMKWYTIPGTKTSKNMYNAELASQQRDLIVITEGAFDVMRIGTRPGMEKYAVGVFGHSISEHQKRMLWENWGRHDAVAILAFDPDVYVSKDKQGEKDLKKVLELEAWFKQQWKYFHALRLPEGGDDIGAMSSEMAWTTIDNVLGGLKNGVV